ncbi:hypothetical protein WKW80_26935 [Variovorax humicola]|uniref:Uncharacterized protein n=1 Tax=Variovorax humicola TaxID=1769758 RepID=A0ABU8W6I3_9BURK
MPTAYDLPNDNDTAGYLNPSLLAEAERIARQKSQLQANALQAARQQGIYAPPDQPGEVGGWTSSVTGTRMPGTVNKTPVSGILAPLGARALDAFSQSKLDEDVSGFNRIDAAAAQAHLQRKPPDNAPDQVKLQWAQQGATIPSLKPAMEAYVQDQLTKAPERAENRAWRSSEAEATRQSRADQAERDRKSRELIAQQGNDLRATIAQLVHSAQGGDKASDYQIVTDPGTGTVYRVGKKPGAPAEKVEGVTGTTGADVRKTQADAATAVSNAKEGLATLDRMAPLFDKATTSGAKAGGQAFKSFFTGDTTPDADALKQLKIEAANLAKFADRKMFGPQFTDADVKAIKESVGSFDQPMSLTARRAAEAKLREIFTRAAGGVAPSAPEDNSVRANVTRGVEAATRETGNYKPPSESSVDRTPLIQQWKSETPERRPLIEQQMQGMVYKGHTYLGGDPSSPSSWSK